MSGRVLLVDDEPDAVATMRDALVTRGFRCEVAFSAEDCLAHLTEQHFDVVLTDIRMPGMSGLELTRALAERHPDVLAIVVTGSADMETAIEAIRAGAFDFLVKPLRIEAMTIAVARALETLQLRREVRRLREVANVEAEVSKRHGIAGASQAIRTTLELVARVGESDATILVTGETGTGKELVARAVHACSSRREGPFVAINCGAMPAPLLESELFGHVRGAFTDARETRQGLLAAARGGTVFLDEIGEMPLEMQAKLLRVLQERSVRPVGGDVEHALDVRIVAATNKDLEVEVEEKRFREDLFYRINVVAVPVPPLRMRGGDVLVLAQFFVLRAARRTGKKVVGIAESAARRLVDYDWPGNVRELENAIERAVALSRLDQITADDLPAKLRADRGQLVVATATPAELITLHEMERRYARTVLDACDGNKAHAARVLGIDRRSLYRRLE